MQSFTALFTILAAAIAMVNAGPAIVIPECGFCGVDNVPACHQIAKYVQEPPLINTKATRTFTEAYKNKDGDLLVQLARTGRPAMELSSTSEEDALLKVFYSELAYNQTAHYVLPKGKTCIVTKYADIYNNNGVQKLTFLKA